MTYMQAVLFPVCIAAALLFPNALEAFREAAAKEQARTAAKAVDALNHDSTLAKLPAPPEATKRLKLQVQNAWPGCRQDLLLVTCS